MRKPTFEEISDFIEYRANHVALVQKLGRAALDMDFSDHDCDKIEATGKDEELLTLRFLDKKGKIRTSEEDKNILRKVSANHALNSKHHAEYWDTSVNIRNFNEEDKNIIHATNMLKRYLAEMACDWSACALYHNEPIFKWFNKVINEYLFFTDNQIKYLEDCLKKITKAIGKEEIRFPGVKYTAQQIPPKDWRKEKLKEEMANIETAKRALEDEVLKDENLDLQLFKTNKGNKALYSGIVRPTDSKTREEHQQDISNIKINTSDENKEGFRLSGISEIEGPEAKKLGYSFNPVEVSKTTPVTLLDFNNPDTDTFFQVALGFKRKLGEGSSAPTKITEPLTAEAICAQINLGDCSYIEDKDIPELNEKGLEGWLKTFVNTAILISNSDFIEKDKRYVVCRGSEIFSESNGIIEKSKEFNSLGSIHNLINSLIKKRKDLFRSASKDAWNPADIYIIKESEYSEFYNNWSKLMDDYTVTKDQYNNILLSEVQNKNIIGVSLKKLQKGSKGTLIPVNLSQNYDRSLFKPFILPPTDPIRFPKMKVIPDNSNETLGVGIYFSCNTVDNHDDYDSVRYTYRSFQTENPLLQMELIGNPSGARVGKTPKSLVVDFQSDNDIYTQNQEGEKFKVINPENYSKWIQNQIKIFLSDEIINKVDFIGKNLPTINADKEQMNLSNWRRYVNDIEKSSLIKNMPTDTNRMVELLRWTGIIDMLFALSVSKSKGNENYQKDLSNIYNWSKKEGIDFAPYILIH